VHSVAKKAAMTDAHWADGKIVWRVAGLVAKKAVLTAVHWADGKVG